MGRLSRPLNSDAVKAADDEFYAKHPELVKDGKRIPLSATDPSQADLRKEWVELYKKHGGKEEDDEKKPPAKKPDDPVEPCPNKPKPKLVRLTVIQNATQTHVTGAKNWATVKKSTDDVIVEATTTPNNNEEEWKQINWSGDSGTAVPGKPNQRKLSRSTSKKYHVEAELGGVKDHVDVWVLWATVTILTSSTTPANAVQFGARYDGTENLGAQSYDAGNKAVGKVVPVALITPAGVHDIVKSGWAFKRERMSHDWADGEKYTPPKFGMDYWNTTWLDDTSSPSFQALIPDEKDKIYDRDAPNIGAFGANDYETYNNFREWIEWNADTCSDKANWYWQGRWQKSTTPQVTLKDVGTGDILLPEKSHFHP
jgi:hypothetical protein